MKGWGRVDKLGRGEVAERLNAAVSKTVTSVIPASGVRIPPSPPLEASGLGLRVSGLLSAWPRVRPEVYRRGRDRVSAWSVGRSAGWHPMPDR